MLQRKPIRWAASESGASSSDSINLADQDSAHRQQRSITDEAKPRSTGLYLMMLKRSHLSK